MIDSRVAFAGSFGNSTRNLQPAALRVGAEYIVDRAERIRRALETNRINYHMPFGWNRREIMDFDAYTECLLSKDPALRLLAKSFVPLVSAWMKANPEVQSYVYLGSPPADVDFLSRRSRYSAYYHRFFSAVHPVLKLAEKFPGRVGLILDKSHEIDESHPLAGLMLSVHNCGGLMPLIVEGGTAIRVWQSQAGFGRYMIWETFKKRLDAPVEFWRGEQILQPNTAAQIQRQDPGWELMVNEAGFNTCFY